MKPKTILFAFYEFAVNINTALGINGLKFLDLWLNCFVTEGLWIHFLCRQNCQNILSLHQRGSLYTPEMSFSSGVNHGE